MVDCRCASSIRSILFKTTNIRSQVISPMIKHSAVWVCMPLVMSMTSNMRSMIWAPWKSQNSNFYMLRKRFSDQFLPPMIVRMSDACPGQSTSVIWIRLTCKCSGASIINEEKPRSSVIPRSWLWGFLSNAFVLNAKKWVELVSNQRHSFVYLAIVLNAFARLVLPESTCPRTPTLKFKIDICKRK